MPIDMEMGTFRVATKDWLRITSAAIRAKVTRSEFIRRAVLEAVELQQATKAGQR